MNLEDFLTLWRSDAPTLTVHTSGSTGAPRPLEIEKARMRSSARMTTDFLELTAADTALLCMPLRYIAGMMMVVRAEVAGMRLISVVPSSHPLAGLHEVPDFAAMVPAQVFETLRVPVERELFCQIRHVIIGGGALDTQLENELRTLPNHVWHSYGMTETLSHIALREISPQWKDSFLPLPGIRVQSNADGCMVIEAPHLVSHPLVTHDIAAFRSDGSFRILGRTDNVICSGGIKIQIEEVEAALRPTFGDTIQVTSAPHPKFGEMVVYLTTQTKDDETLLTILRRIVSNPYWLPRRILHVKALPRTGTGKPDRAKAKALAR